MQPRQTPKWLSLFNTAFGPKGMIALAWWMGALHAERIRAAQRSYPFLGITSNCNSAQFLLLRVLFNLLGRDRWEPIGTADSAKALQQLKSDCDWPVVLEHQSAAFDWDRLRPLYNGDGVWTNRQAEPSKFRGALMVLGQPEMTDALRSRFVFVELGHAHHTDESAQALQDLLDMHRNGGFGFYDTVEASGERLAGLMQHTTAYYIQPHDNKRAAFNHAQLHALLGVLDDLFVLPTDAREDAHIEIAAMCLITD